MSIWCHINQQEFSVDKHIVIEFYILLTMHHVMILVK